VDLLGAGDLFGEGALRPDARWPATAWAMTDTTAYVLPAAHVSRLGQYYPQIPAQVCRMLSARLERAHRGADLVNTTCARERTLRLLHLLAEAHGQLQGEEIWLPITLTQAQLGDLVKLTRETIARALAELERRGAIRRSGRRGLWLKSSFEGRPPLLNPTPVSTN
jgi:CRP/FNR family transcriptional regulator